MQEGVKSAVSPRSAKVVDSHLVFIVSPSCMSRPWAHWATGVPRVDVRFGEASGDWFSHGCCAIVGRALKKAPDASVRNEPHPRADAVRTVSGQGEHRYGSSVKLDVAARIEPQWSYSCCGEGP